MSQYIYTENTLRITLGYDRVLDYVFCMVQIGGRMKYSNLDDPKAGTEQKDVNYFRPILQEKVGFVPELVLRAAQRDRVGGNVTKLFTKCKNCQGVYCSSDGSCGCRDNGSQ